MSDTYNVTEDKKLEVCVNGTAMVYDLNEPLEETFPIVVREKKDILKQMDLKTVINNLDNAVDLLDVSYHAVYGFAVQAKIFRLQKNLMDLNDKGIIVVGEFRDKSQTVQAELKAVFQWLVKGMESVAIGKLERFAVYAAGMSQQAQELADDYQKMADSTSAILEETMEESSKQYAKMDELRNMMNEFQAKIDAANKVQEETKRRLNSLNEEYAKLSDAEERAEKQQNKMAVIGAVFSFVGDVMSGIGSVIPEMSGSNKQTSDAGTGTGGEQSDDETKAKLEEEQKKKAENDQAMETLKNEIAELEKSLKKLTEETDSSEDQDKRAAKQKEYQEQIRSKQEELKNLEKESKTFETAIAGIQNIISSAGQRIDQMAEDARSISEQRSQRLNDINKERMRLEDSNTEQLALLAENTKKLAGIVIDQNSTEAAVQALIIAVSCLKKVVVAVKDIELFWNSMEACCRSLADSSLKDTIKDLQQIDKEDRIEAYYSDMIMYPLLCYIAKWAAIGSISREYIAAAEKTRDNLNTTVTTADSSAMSRTDHWNKASQLAEQVSTRISTSITKK